MKILNKNIDLYVQETSLAKSSYTWVLALILFVAIFLFIKHQFLFGIVVIVIMLVVQNNLKEYQKDLKYNLMVWNKFVPEGVFFYIDNNAGKIFLTGAEIPFTDVKQINFIIAEQPRSKGKTKELFEKKFINANIEITTATKVYTTPIQTRQGIKDLEKVFKSLNLRTILDVKLYHI